MSKKIVNLKDKFKVLDQHETSSDIPEEMEVAQNPIKEIDSEYNEKYQIISLNIEILQTYQHPNVNSLFDYRVSDLKSILEIAACNTPAQLLLVGKKHIPRNEVIDHALKQRISEVRINHYKSRTGDDAKQENESELIEFSSKHFNAEIYIFKKDDKFRTGFYFYFGIGVHHSLREYIRDSKEYSSRDKALSFALNCLKLLLAGFSTDDIKERKDAVLNALSWVLDLQLQIKSNILSESDEPEKNIDQIAADQEPADEQKDLSVIPAVENKEISLLEKKLNDAEKAELQNCESIIEKVFNTSHDAWKALLFINENKLYRENYKTFEQYLSDKWGMNRKQGYELMGFARVINNLECHKICDTDDSKKLPRLENHIRPLLTLEPEQQVEAWQKVLELEEKGEKITGKLVEEKAAEYRSPVKKDEIKAPEKVTPSLNKSVDVELPPEPETKPGQLPGQISISEAIAIKEKEELTEQVKVSVPVTEYIVDVPVKVGEPKMMLTQSVIDAAKKTMGIVDFSINDENTSPFIPGKAVSGSYLNVSNSYVGRGVLNLISDDNFNKYIQSAHQSVQTGDAFELIIFAKADFSSKWFRILSGYSPVFSALNINLPYPVVAFYFGHHPDRFAKCFDLVGRTVSTYAVSKEN